jgi:hypothetical protein
MPRHVVRDPAVLFSPKFWLGIFLKNYLVMRFTMELSLAIG